MPYAGSCLSVFPVHLSPHTYGHVVCRTQCIVGCWLQVAVSYMRLCFAAGSDLISSESDVILRKEGLIISSTSAKCKQRRIEGINGHGPVPISSALSSQQILPSAL